MISFFISLGRMFQLGQSAHEGKVNSSTTEMNLN